MNDLTLPIVFFTVLAGYFFTTQGKNKRNNLNNRNSVNPNEVPNGNNIYSSDVVDQANREILRLSIENYKRSKDPAKTGVLPPLFNTYSRVGGPLANGIDESGTQQAESFISNRIEDFSGNTSTRPLLERPMFQQFIKEEQDSDEKTSKSLLTGKSLDTSHNNMVPFFGSSVKQNTESFSNQRLLDLHTGNTSTYKNKQEVEQFFNEMPENIFGMPALTTAVSSDRYIASVYRQNEPSQDPERIAAPIAGTVDNNIRPEFKSVDELRTWDKLKESYEGRTIAGQMGNVRGASTNVEKNRPDTYFKQDSDRYIKTTGAFTATKLSENFENIKPTTRTETTTEYFGSASSIENKKTRQRLAKSIDGADSLVQDPKRFNFENDYSRNLSGAASSTDYGKSGMNFPETERATTSEETHLIAPQKFSRGIRTKFRDMPKNTMKETTLETDNTGNVNSSFNKGLIATHEIGLVDFNPKTTHKETTIVNNYKGTANNNVSNQMTRINYANAETRDDKEVLSNRDRSAGPQKFRIRSGKASVGDMKHTGNMELRELEDDRDRTLNPTNSQIISDKTKIGIKTKFREDNECLDRLNPELVSQQLADNPYSMYGKK